MATSPERIIQAISPSDTLLNVMVLGCSINEANTFVQTLRNSGMAVHMTTAYNPDELEDVLGNQSADLVLVNTDAEELDFTTAITQVREVNPNASFILLSDNPTDQLFFAAETRAQDIVSGKDLAHLIYAANREQQSVETRKARDAARKELEETIERCNTLTETAGEAIAYVHEGMHVYANPAYITLFNFSEVSDVDGLPIMDLVAPDDRKQFKSVLRSLDKDQRADKIEINCITDTGKTFEASMEFSPASIEGELCTQVTIKDQSPHEELQKRIAELTKFDPDTGLYNRKHFTEQLETAVANSITSGEKLSLILLDISNHMEIKDEYGLEGSDNVLKDSAKIIAGIIYDTDLLARFGEHEFSILCTAGTDALALCNRLLETLTKHLFKSSDQLITPRFSVGVTYSDAPPVNGVHDFLNHANKATRHAKEHKGSYIAEYDADVAAIHTGAVTDDDLIKMIDRALENDGFKLVYQPMVSLHGNSREDYAVYVRLLDDHGEQILPAQFLSGAENADRMAEIDRWIIRNAIKEVLAQRNQNRKLNFLINISAAGIQDDSILLWICDCLREFKAKGSWLTFQFKQKDVIRHLEIMDQLVEGLRKINCKIAIDHFSCEQEGINLIRHVSFDLAKFAPDLTADLTKSKDHVELLQNYNQQIQNLGVRTAVTAVEEANQLAVLWNVGVDYIQGNFIQEPTDTIAYDLEE